jgi:hypothetical protein
MSGLNPLNPLNQIPDIAQDKWYGWLVKPTIMVMAFMVFSYATLWMSQHYVTNEKFGEYVKIQTDSDKRQDEQAEKRFEITQAKLETIINQQVSYSEQLKAYNTIMVSIQKQVDNIDNRVIYLERYHSEHGDKNTIQPPK